jgi:hypothetical protein
MGIASTDTDATAGRRGFVADPTETRIPDIKAWSEVNGIITGDVVVIYRPNCARLVSYQLPSQKPQSMGGKRVKSESWFQRQLDTILN